MQCQAELRSFKESMGIRRGRYWDCPKREGIEYPRMNAYGDTAHNYCYSTSRGGHNLHRNANQNKNTDKMNNVFTLLIYTSLQDRHLNVDQIFDKCTLFIRARRSKHAQSPASTQVIIMGCTSVRRKWIKVWYRSELGKCSRPAVHTW